MTAPEKCSCLLVAFFFAQISQIIHMTQTIIKAHTFQAFQEFEVIYLVT